MYTQDIRFASQCTKSDGPFYCQECFSDAVLRKCTEKRDHFAHKARLSPVIGPQEGALHKNCKNELVALLQERFPDGKWAVERTIEEKKEKGLAELRPDISGRIRGTPVAIEVQASALTPTKIIKRANEYTKRGIYLLWIVPLKEPLGELAFRPRLYERYLHSIYCGRTYYWWANQGLTVQPVHYGPAVRHIEYREWIENGSHMSGGGYDSKYRVIKSPVYGRSIDIAEGFEAEIRGEFTPDNERKAVPRCAIWKDTLSAWWTEHEQITSPSAEQGALISSRS